MPIRVNKSKAQEALPGFEKGPDGAFPVSQLATILDSMPESISIHSSDDKLLWANKKLCDLYCMPLARLVGLSCSDVFHVDDPGCPHGQVLTTGDAVRCAQEIHLSGRHLSVMIEPLFDEHGGTCGFIRLMRDVTGERQAQEHLRSAERLATLGQLLLGVAHDVGTPLNVISGYAEFLLMRTKPDGQGHKELSAILDQTRRITAVFGQALDLARPPQGTTNAIEVKALLTDSMDLVGHHLRRTDVKGALTCRITPPLIYGEAPQLRQAFFNLLLNAGQYVGTGGTLELVVDEASEMPGFLGLTLQATEASGVAHDFSQSFGVLIAAKSEGETAGIGLYLAKSILDQARARVAFARDKAQGVCLRIYLPLNPASRT